jgi:hypothetical protein
MSTGARLLLGLNAEVSDAGKIDEPNFLIVTRPCLS